MTDIESLVGCSESDCDTCPAGGSTISKVRTATAGTKGSATKSRTLLLGATTNNARKTTEDVFAQIILCSESSKENLGMPKYAHLHLKISQTVCNAIFLCKVTSQLPTDNHNVQVLIKSWHKFWKPLYVKFS